MLNEIIPTPKATAKVKLHPLGYSININKELSNKNAEACSISHKETGELEDLQLSF